MNRIVLLVLLFATLDTSKTSQQGSAHNTAVQQHAQNAENQTATPPSQAIAIYNEPSRKPDEREIQHEQDAIGVERQLAKYTWDLVIVGIIFGVIQSALFSIQAVLFFQQKEVMKEHKKAFDELASAVSNSERPWIRAKAHLPDKLRPVGEKRVTRFFWNIHSAGRSPATVIESDAVVWRVADMTTIPKQPLYEGPPMKMHTMLTPDDVVSIYWMIEPAGQGLTIDEVAKIRDGKLTLFVYGFVRYLDSDKRTHTTRFCQTYHVPTDADDPKKEGFYSYLSAPPAYTECD